ncbi:MAG: thymidylate kinase [Oscillospiraceae bacterium]|nr:thymidylate kinase [Oscillospiraceae bacterium]
MMGKLIVFEGIDGSGKSTQFNMLTDHLERDGKSFRRLRFPRYSEPSSALVRMYLNGDFGTHPSDVNAYAASAFFAVDRFASFASDWRGYYNGGGLLLTDRYTTSNAIHQGSKLSGSEQTDFFRWLYEFEFDQMRLPKPDAVIYIDLPADMAIERLRSREQETGTNADIHEQDSSYLFSCRETGLKAAEYYGWHVVKAYSGNTGRSIDEIHNEIYSIVMKGE